MERWFGIMHDHFDRSFPTYCGAKIEDRPEDLAKVLRELRNVPTFHNVVDRFTGFIDGYNADCDHAMDDLIDRETRERLSPGEAMSRWCTTRRVFAPGVLDMAMQTWHKPVKVGRNGVKITIAGMSLDYGQFNHDLIAHKGKNKRVMVSYDPNDLSFVKIYDLQMRLITDAYANELGGMNKTKLQRRHISKLLREQRAYNNAMKVIKANPELQYLSKQELLAESLANEAKGKPTPPTEPGSLKLIQTPLDGQSNAIQKHEQRMAAGAEYDPEPMDLDLSKFNTLGNFNHDDDDDNLDLSQSWANLVKVTIHNDNTDESLDELIPDSVSSTDEADAVDTRDRMVNHEHE